MGSARFSSRPGDGSRPGGGPADESRSGGDRPARGKARDRTEEQLLDRLRGLPVGAAPDPRFANELRSQLVSIAPRIIAESEPEVVRSRRRAGFLGTVRRPLVAFAGAAVVLVLLLGLAVQVSHGALPGQSLYGVKRASENVKLSLADGDTGRAKVYLQQATSRAGETIKLVTGGQPVSPHVTQLLVTTLSAADADTRSGVALLGKATLAQASAAPIAGIGTWVSQQTGRLTELSGRLPDGAARTRTATSLALLHRVSERVTGWQRLIGCPCLAKSGTDDLGPVPCRTCLPAPAGSGGPSGLPTLPTGPTASIHSGGPTPSLTLPSLGGGPSPSTTRTP